MITIVALLTIRDPEAFDQFERQAAAIMNSYGGGIEVAFRPKASSKPAPNVDEVHVLKFPNHDAFDRYRSDDRLLALSALRQSAISQSTVYVSGIEVNYSGLE